jgi:hypothetical protein
MIYYIFCGMRFELRALHLQDKLSITFLMINSCGEDNVLGHLASIYWMNKGMNQKVSVDEDSTLCVLIAPAGSIC